MVNFELVLPCYNEAPNLNILVQKFIGCALEAGLTPDSFQMILVNNGSTDDSSKILNKLISAPETKDWIKVVSLAQNKGYGHGLWAGLQTCRAPIVGWSHADLQADPRELFRAYFMLPKRPHKNLVRGSREGRGLKDRLVSFTFAKLSDLVLGLGLNEINAQPKVFTREILDLPLDPPADFAFDLYMLYQMRKQDYQINEIKVLFPPRLHGESKWASRFTSKYRMILASMAYIFSLRWRSGHLIPWLKRSSSRLLFLLIATIWLHLVSLPVVKWISQTYSVTIFKSSMAVSFVLAAALFGLCLLLLRRRGFLFSIIFGLFALSYGINFSVFVPVFLDRSITYQIVTDIGSKPDQMMKHEDLIKSLMSAQSIEYRINMLKTEGYLTQQGDKYFLTAKGRSFAKLLDVLHDFSGIYPHLQ